MNNLKHMDDCVHEQMSDGEGFTITSEVWLVAWIYGWLGGVSNAAGEAPPYLAFSQNDFFGSHFIV